MILLTQNNTTKVLQRKNPYTYREINKGHDEGVYSSLYIKLNDVSGWSNHHFLSDVLISLENESFDYKQPLIETTLNTSQIVTTFVAYSFDNFSFESTFIPFSFYDSDKKEYQREIYSSFANKLSILQNKYNVKSNFNKFTSILNDIPFSTATQFIKLKKTLDDKLVHKELVNTNLLVTSTVQFKTLQQHKFFYRNIESVGLKRFLTFNENVTATLDFEIESYQFNSNVFNLTLQHKPFTSEILDNDVLVKNQSKHNEINELYLHTLNPFQSQSVRGLQLTEQKSQLNIEQITTQDYIVENEWWEHVIRDKVYRREPTRYFLGTINDYLTHYHNIISLKQLSLDKSLKIDFSKLFPTMTSVLNPHIKNTNELYKSTFNNQKSIDGTKETLYDTLRNNIGNIVQDFEVTLDKESNREFLYDVILNSLGNTEVSYQLETTPTLSKENILKYINSVNGDKVNNFNTISDIQSNTEVFYSVLHNINRDKTTPFNISNYKSVGSEVLHNLLKNSYSDIRTEFNILSNSTSQVEVINKMLCDIKSDTLFVYDTLHKISGDKETFYNVLHNSINTSKSVHNNLHNVDGNKTSIFNILNNISTNKETRYNVLSNQNGNKETTYVIEQLVNGNKETRYSVLSNDFGTKETNYNISFSQSGEKSSKVKFKNTLDSSINLQFINTKNTTDVVLKNLFHTNNDPLNFSILTQLFKRKGVSGVIKSLLDKKSLLSSSFVTAVKDKFNTYRSVNVGFHFERIITSSSLLHKIILSEIKKFIRPMSYNQQLILLAKRIDTNKNISEFTYSSLVNGTYVNRTKGVLPRVGNYKRKIQDGINFSNLKKFKYTVYVDENINEYTFNLSYDSFRQTDHWWQVPYNQKRNVEKNDNEIFNCMSMFGGYNEIRNYLISQRLYLSKMGVDVIGVVSKLNSMTAGAFVNEHAVYSMLRREIGTVFCNRPRGRFSFDLYKFTSSTKIPVYGSEESVLIPTTVEQNINTTKVFTVTNPETGETELEEIVTETELYTEEEKETIVGGKILLNPRTIEYKQFEFRVADDIPASSTDYEFILEVGDIDTPITVPLTATISNTGVLSGMFGDMREFEEKYKTIERVEKNDTFFYKLPVNVYALNKNQHFYKTYTFNIEVYHNFSLDRDRMILESGDTDDAMERFKDFVKKGYIDINDYDGYITIENDEVVIHNDLVKVVNNKLISSSNFTEIDKENFINNNKLSTLIEMVKRGSSSEID